MVLMATSFGGLGLQEFASSAFNSNPWAVNEVKGQLAGLTDSLASSPGHTRGGVWPGDEATDS